MVPKDDNVDDDKQQLLTPSEIEALAIEAFARVRGEKTTLAWCGSTGVAFEFVPGEAKTGVWGTRLTVRLIIYEGPKTADGDIVVRDIKEQEVAFVPPEADDAQLPAYFEGLALGIRALIERGTAEVDTWMPHEFVPEHAFKEPPKRITAADFAKCVGEKTSSGNAALPDADDLTGTEAIAVNLELERAIEEDPERVENYLVYADWLTERGDPRGELITFSRPGAPPIAGRRAAQVLARNERYFAGNLRSASPADTEGGIFLTWALGFISAAWIGAEYSLYEDNPRFVTEALAGLVGHPSSKFLRKLTLGCFDFEGNNDYAKLYPLLVKGGARRTMRTLYFGDTNSEQQEISWTHALDFKALNGLYPNLEDLTIHAGAIGIEGALASYPKLKSLTLESGGLRKENLTEIANAKLLELTTLDVWTGSESYGGDSTIEEMRPLIRDGGERFPKLTRLGIKNCGYTDEVCRELAESKPGLLERLTELDLSMGVMGDEGVAMLVSARERLTSLQKLDVSSNFLSEDGIESLRAAMGSAVVLDDLNQKRAYGGETPERYVSVTE